MENSQVDFSDPTYENVDKSRKRHTASAINPDKIARVQAGPPSTEQNGKSSGNIGSPLRNIQNDQFTSDAGLYENTMVSKPESGQNSGPPDGVTTAPENDTNITCEAMYAEVNKEKKKEETTNQPKEEENIEPLYATPDKKSTAPRENESTSGEEEEETTPVYAQPMKKPPPDSSPKPKLDGGV